MTLFRSGALGAFLLGLFLFGASTATAQTDRVRLYGQDLFLNGGNVAWFNFATDAGPGPTNLDGFRALFEEVRENGGNSVRLWLHTNGSSTPAWSGSTTGQVTGPGAGTIDDLINILDIARENGVGVQICLWSFDMLRDSYGPGVTTRARALLTSATLTQTYVDNALTPMVSALAGHPALLAWEVFNEAEGMSIEFGFGGIVSNELRIPMVDIQRFTNQVAGGIHRADPNALVTNGSVNFRSLTDTQRPNGSGRLNFNYYEDARLVAQGNDPLGTLDFYSVHYYTNNIRVEMSPFANDASVWGLTKPIVVGEFYAPDVTPTLSGAPVAFGDLYTTLYDRGYAGAMIWQYFDRFLSDPDRAQNWPRGLQNMQTMFNQHRAAVEVVLPGPNVTSFTADEENITTGASTTLRWTVAGATQVTLNNAPVAATATQTVSPTETTIYVLLATDAAGLSTQRRVTVRVTPPTMGNRFEAEDAAIAGAGVTVRTDLPAASGTRYVRMENEGSVTWTVDAPAAGEYPITFGYYLPFERKEQFLDVNGVRVDTVRFEAPINTFLTTGKTVRLVAGSNTITLRKFFGYMNFDYLDVQFPVSGETGPAGTEALALTAAPNPFSAATRLRYTLATSAEVTVDVFDVTGRRVARLAEGQQSVGEHEVGFDASSLPAGVYIARITAGGTAETRRLLVVR